MKRHILVATLATLAACGSGDTVEMENASVGEVAQEMRKADVDQSFVNPGKWKQTATLVEIDAPGMPPRVAEAMKKSMGTSQVHETCLTPEKAKNPREDFFTGADEARIQEKLLEHVKVQRTRVAEEEKIKREKQAAAMKAGPRGLLMVT